MCRSFTVGDGALWAVERPKITVAYEMVLPRYARDESWLLAKDKCGAQYAASID